jgi:hypothetical protein
MLISGSKYSADYLFYSDGTRTGEAADAVPLFRWFPQCNVYEGYLRKKLGADFCARYHEECVPRHPKHVASEDDLVDLGKKFKKSTKVCSYSLSDAIDELGWEKLCIEPHKYYGVSRSYTFHGGRVVVPKWGNGDKDVGCFCDITATTDMVAVVDHGQRGGRKAMAGGGGGGSFLPQLVKPAHGVAHHLTPKPPASKKPKAPEYVTEYMHAIQCRDQPKMKPRADPLRSITRAVHEMDNAVFRERMDDRLTALRHPGGSFLPSLTKTKVASEFF